MDEPTITKARKLAVEFMEAADAARSELRDLYPDSARRAYYSGTKTSGHLRRKSLELTRVLAEMRRP